MLTAGAPTTTVLFDDQFNGTKLDKTKWRPNWLGSSDTAVTKPVNTQEQSCYDPAQVAEGFGVLVLSAAQRLCPANNGITYPYASGMVETAHDFLFTYGRLEARIWVAPGSGSHPQLARVLGERHRDLADDGRAQRDGRAARVGLLALPFVEWRSGRMRRGSPTPAAGTPTPRTGAPGPSPTSTTGCASVSSPRASRRDRCTWC